MEYMELARAGPEVLRLVNAGAVIVDAKCRVLEFRDIQMRCGGLPQQVDDGGPHRCLRRRRGPSGARDPAHTTSSGPDMQESEGTA